MQQGSFTASFVVSSSELAAPIPDVNMGQPGDLNDRLIATDIWTDEMVHGAGIPMVDTGIVTIGGGIGSFVLADFLRIAGMSTSQMLVASNIDTPWQTYEYLTKVSQIPRPERLRSDSTGCPDNIWGFPGYALREAVKEKTIAPLFQVTVEPIFTDFYTPRAGFVFEALEREANRINWAPMVRRGQVRMVRRRHGGGYFTILTPPPGSSVTKRIALRSGFVHLAVGYPGLRFLPDLQEYRQRTGDIAHVVNAYEPHENVYQALLARPSVVLVRGGGIVASRVLQRLMEDRMNLGAQTQIVHLFRTYVDGPNKQHRFAKRQGGGGFAYQGFNWPKGSWGGQLKEEFERLEGEQRAALYKQLGGAHTPKRKLWQDQKARAQREGWYVTAQGEVASVDRGADGKVVTMIRSANGSQGQFVADYVIDCTGLEADLKEHRVLADLLDHSGAGRNPMGRLDVERTFEIRGTRSGNGRMYASGAATLGGYYAGVDSFLGLQYAALQIADDLASTGFVPKIGISRSISEWFRWARHQPVPDAAPAPVGAWQGAAR
jgi:hypothetical protein